MLLSGGETSNDAIASDSSTSQHQIGSQLDGHRGSGHMRNNLGTNPWNLEGRALSALNKFGENAMTASDPVWLRRVQHQQSIMEPLGIFSALVHSVNVIVHAVLCNSTTNNHCLLPSAFLQLQRQ